MKKETGFILITHYERLFEYIKPDFIHAIFDGKIVETGDMSLVEKIKKMGYNWIKERNF